MMPDENIGWPFASVRRVRNRSRWTAQANEEIDQPRRGRGARLEMIELLDTLRCASRLNECSIRGIEIRMVSALDRKVRMNVRNDGSELPDEDAQGRVNDAEALDILEQNRKENTSGLSWDEVVEQKKAPWKPLTEMGEGD
jgi:hypothetical protein